MYIVVHGKSIEDAKTFTILSAHSKTYPNKQAAEKYANEMVMKHGKQYCVLQILDALYVEKSVVKHKTKGK